MKDNEDLEYVIEKGTLNNIDELESLYNELNDYLEAGTNYSGWIKGIYPVRQTAEVGVFENNLFVLKVNNEIAGTVILNHKPDLAYSQVIWGIQASCDEVIIVHTLAVHPKYMGMGIAKKILEFIKEYAIQNNMRAIRLDVSIHNTPAISLYERCGYKYIGTVDLGLGYPNLVWFKLYEVIL